MFLFLLCVSFGPFATNEGKEYQPINAVRSKNIRSLTPGYYHIQTTDNSIISEYPEIFNSDTMANSNWFTSYLNVEQIEILISSNKSILFPVHRSFKENTKIKGLNKFLIKCPQQFIDQIDRSLFTEIKYVSKDLYSLTTSYSNIKKAINLFINSPEVLSYSELPTIKLLNRWAKGFVQNGDDSIAFNGGTYVGNNSLNALGYLGKDQVATIEDSGVDTSLRYFKDNSINVPINKVDRNHRKIIKYKTLEKSDHADYSGHGTHCAGSICGENIDDNDYFSAYNGGAPKAKLFVVDLEDSHGNMYIDNDFTNTISDMNSVGSFVSSNSWGLDVESAQVKYIYDIASYQNPSILWVFAAGNSYGFGTVLDPGSCKNVLTVGALDRVRNYYFESPGTTRFDLITNESSQVTEPDLFFVQTEYDAIMSSITTPQAINAYNKTAVFYEAGNSSYSDAAVYSTDCDQALDAVNRGSTLILAGSILSCPDKNIQNAIGVVIPSSATFNTSILGRKVSLVPKVVSSQSTLSMKVASFSSKGPSIYGPVKPEVVAPGTDIISADRGHYDSLTEMSGTSMACPTTSGEMIILREYVIDKFGITKPTSNLLKALVICGASKPSKPEVPDNEWGFGMLNIGNVVEAISGNKVLIQNEISINFGKTLSFDLIVVDKNRPLSVAMAYIDPAVAAESRNSLIVDLDLFVVSPKGNLLHPIGNSEDQYSTVERIYVQAQNIEIGTYHVYVKASQPDVSSPTSIPLSLVAIGNISSFTPTPSSSTLLDNSTNSPWTNVCTLPSSVATADGCKCDDSSTGLFCQHDVINIPAGSDQVYTIPSMETVYLKGVLSGMNENFNLNLYQQTTPYNYLNIHTNPNNLPDKILNYAYVNKFNRTKMSLTGYPSSGFSSNSPVYFAITNFGSFNSVVTLSLTIDEPPLYGDYVDRNVPAPSIMGTTVACIVVAIFVIVIIFVVVFCVKSKKRSRANRNNHHHNEVNNDNVENAGGGTANISVPPEYNGSYVPPSYPSGYNNTYPYPAPNYPPQNVQVVSPAAYSPSPASPSPYVNAPEVEPQPVPDDKVNTKTNQDQTQINPYDPANFPTVNANNNANRPSYYPPYADPDDDK